MTTGRPSGVYCFELEKFGRRRGSNYNVVGAPFVHEFEGKQRDFGIVQVGVIFPKKQFKKQGKIRLIITGSALETVKLEFNEYFFSNSKKKFLDELGQGVMWLFILKNGWASVKDTGNLLEVVKWVNLCDSPEAVKSQILRKL